MEPIAHPRYSCNNNANTWVKVHPQNESIRTISRDWFPKHLVKYLLPNQDGMTEFVTVCVVSFSVVQRIYYKWTKSWSDFPVWININFFIHIEGPRVTSLSAAWLRFPKLSGRICLHCKYPSKGKRFCLNNCTNRLKKNLLFLYTLWNNLHSHILCNRNVLSVSLHKKTSIIIHYMIDLRG